MMTNIMGKSKTEKMISEYVSGVEEDANFQ